MSDNGDGGSGGLGDLARIAGKVGLSVVQDPLKNAIRERVVRLVSSRDPAELENAIIVRSNIIENKLPTGLKTALSKYGDGLDDEINEYVRAEKVLSWMEHPETWMEADADSEVVEGVREAREVILTTDGGRAWLEWQCEVLRSMAGADDDPE